MRSAALRVPLIINAMMAAMTAVAQAQNTDPKAETIPIPTACAEQIKESCGDATNPRDVLKCLVQRIDSLPLACRQDVQRFARAASQASEQTEGALTGPSALNSLTPPFPVLNLESRYSPGDVSMSEERLNVSTPALKTKDDFLALSLAGARIHLSEAVPLGTGTDAPQDIYRAEVGAQYTHQLGGYRNWGLRASVGYAGDRLFHSLNDTAFSLAAHYGYPTSRGTFWMWTVYISNNSPLGNYVPIPGLFYMRKTPTFTGMFGFPITSLQWTPAKNQAYSVSLLGLSLTTEAAYGDIRELQWFTGLKWTTQSFILKDRKEEKDRLTVEEKRAMLGVRKFLLGRVQLEAQGGYAFDRLLYSGTGLRNMRDGSAKLDPNWFISASLKAGF